MSKNIKKLPSGAKLFFRRLKAMQLDLTIKVRRFVRERPATTLTGSIPLEDVPQFLQEVKRRHAEIIAEQKEIRQRSAWQVMTPHSQCGEKGGAQSRPRYVKAATTSAPGPHVSTPELC